MRAPGGLIAQPLDLECAGGREEGPSWLPQEPARGPASGLVLSLVEPAGYKAMLGVRAGPTVGSSSVLSRYDAPDTWRRLSGVRLRSLVRPDHYSHVPRQIIEWAVACGHCAACNV